MKLMQRDGVANALSTHRCPRADHLYIDMPDLLHMLYRALLA